jgi:hypothetical protein
MATQKINWNLNQNYAFKPVDTISVLNKQIQTTHSAWGDEDELVSPTTRFWLNYKLTSNDRVYGINGQIPFYRSGLSLSSSFNKIVFPSISTEQFLTQSLDSVVYYLDVYTSLKIPMESQSNEHLYLTHSIYSDTSNLIFESTHSSTDYATLALLPNERVFSIAWGDISGSGAISASYLPYTANTLPSKGIYYKYKSILNQTSSLMTVGTGSVERFFAIHLDKEKLKTGIIPGTLQIPFMVSSSYLSFTSSNVYTYDIITLTDNTSSVNTSTALGEYAHIISGTLDVNNISDIYGTVYYDLGLILLNSDKLNSKLNLDLNRREYPSVFGVIDPGLYTENHLNTAKLFNSIQACSYKNINNSPGNLFINPDSVFSPSYFKCKVKENTVQNPIFIVVNANEFNYSNSTAWQENELLPPSELTSSQIPTSCKDFTNLGFGCNEISNLQQKYVYWYYPNKKNPQTIFAAHFLKNETGQCNCEFLGNINEYKKNNRLPHLNYKSYSVKKTFLNNPITYITSIGLYDDEYQLLAVGKLSKPLKKDQFTPYMFKINLNI